jgi:hypothetical protein
VAHVWTVQAKVIVWAHDDVDAHDLVDDLVERVPQVLGPVLGSRRYEIVAEVVESVNVEDD